MGRTKLKNQIGRRRFRLRRLRFVREQFFPAAVAQKVSDLCDSLPSPHHPLRRVPASRAEKKNAAVALVDSKMLSHHRAFQYPRLVTSIVHMV